MDAPIWTRATSGARRRAIPFEVCSAIASQTTALRSAATPSPKRNFSAASDDLEATRRGAEPLGQAEIVQDSAEKEEFFIEPDALRSGGKGPENEGSENMLIYRCVAFHLDQVQRCDGELAVWNPDSRNFTHAILRPNQNIVLELLEVAGTGWRTSQCSRILPASSKRKISTPAVS